MAGFGLLAYEDQEGAIGRVPCPYCQDTDCCGVDAAGDLICCRTEKRVSTKSLRDSAVKHDLPRYREQKLDETWTARVITHQGQGQQPVGSVDLHSVAGYRGTVAGLDEAKTFARDHRDPKAYAGR